MAKPGLVLAVALSGALCGSPLVAQEAAPGALGLAEKAALAAGALTAYGCSYEEGAEIAFLRFARTYAAEQLGLAPADAAAQEEEIDAALAEGMERLQAEGRLAQAGDDPIVALSGCPD